MAMLPAVMLHASNRGRSFQGILLSLYRKQQTNLALTCWAWSVMLQIAALTQYSQFEQGSVNQSRLLHSSPSLCPREQSDCVFGLFFSHIHAVSLAETHTTLPVILRDNNANQWFRLHSFCYCRLARRRTVSMQPGVVWHSYILSSKCTEQPLYLSLCLCHG